jgi:hypothetical protein
VIAWQGLLEPRTPWLEPSCLRRRQRRRSAKHSPTLPPQQHNGLNLRHGGGTATYSGIHLGARCWITVDCGPKFADRALFPCAISPPVFRRAPVVDVPFASSSVDRPCSRSSAAVLASAGHNPVPSAAWPVHFGTSTPFSRFSFAPPFFDGTSVLPSLPGRPTFRVRSLYWVFFGCDLDFLYCRQFFASDSEGIESWRHRIS